MLKEIIAVFIGGGIGSSLRYLISKFSFTTNQFSLLNFHYKYYWMFYSWFDTWIFFEK